MTKEKVLITGASGSLAKRVILTLPSDKYEVVCLTTSPGKVNNKSIFTGTFQSKKSMRRL